MTKRTFDILFSISVLVLCIPLFIVIAIAILASSRGKPFYFHERIGRNGQPFKCYKFRTMYPNADIRLEELLKKHPQLQQEWLNSQKLKNDPRVTPIGKFLRKSSLDELPQFVNVLKGDLSVVGPRPVVKDELVRHYGSKADKILSVRPGITCLWQLSGRNDISYSERIRLDEEYIERQSLWLDIKLICMTIPKIINPRGAY